MKVTFYCKVPKRALSVVEFYKQDILILKSLGYELNIATKYSEIDLKSEVIFIWWWTYAFFPVFIGKLFGKKTIITGTFNYKAIESPIDFYRRPIWQRILIRYSINNATKNILVSRNEYDQIKKDWKLDNLYYSPHIIDTNIYKPNIEVSKANFIFTIIWTGKMNLIRKCLPEIIESAKLVLVKHPDLKFYIAGRKGDGFDYADTLIKKSGLTKNVILLGEITEQKKIKYFQECLMYIQPSRYEGFGLATAEAMSCGAAVISSDVGEVGNVVGDAGKLIKGHNPADIGYAMEELINDDNLRSLLSKRARKRIIENFSFDIRKNDIKTLIEK